MTEDGLGRLQDRNPLESTAAVVRKKRKKLKKLSVNLTLCR
jgi:hypothetical protein